MNGTVARQSATRKTLFKKALAIAEMTAKQWAQEREPSLSETHLYRVLRDPTASAKLVAEIDAFIAEQLPAELLAAAK